MSQWGPSRWFSTLRSPSRRPPLGRYPVGLEHELSTEFLADCMSNTTIHQDIIYLCNLGEYVVPEEEQRRAQLLIENREFRRWLRSQQSEHLLVHGLFGGMSRVSGLSLFCRYLAQVLAWYKPRFITLAFFCGLHTGQQNLAQERPPNYDDTQLGIDADNAPPSYGEAQRIRGGNVIIPQTYDDDTQVPTYSRTQLPSSGGNALIRSFIYQLLRRLPNQRLSMRDRELLNIQSGNLTSLLRLFSRLVGMLPSDAAVWCLVDGAEYYEQDGFWDDTRVVLEQLMQLSNPGNTGPSVRLLITTPTSTSQILEWFRSPQALSLQETGWEDVEVDVRVLVNRLDSAIWNANGSPHSPGLRLSATLFREEQLRPSG